MKRLSLATVAFLATASLSLWGPFSTETQGQSITITGRPARRSTSALDRSR